MLAGMDWLIRFWRYFDSRLSAVRYYIAAASFYGGKILSSCLNCISQLQSQQTTVFLGERLSHCRYPLHAWILCRGHTAGTVDPLYNKPWRNKINAEVASGTLPGQPIERPTSLPL